MKNLFLLLLGFAVPLSCCSNQKTQTPHITLNDSTCIKIIADNIVDTVIFQSSFCSYFPFRTCNGKVIEIVKDGTYYLTYRMTKPDLVKFKIDEEFQSFLIPGDTMIINVGFNTNSTKKASIYYKISGDINDYYQAKKKEFGYYSFADSYDLPISKFFNKMVISVKDYNEALNILNEVTEQNNLFLNKNKKNLSNWFVELEKANINYGSADKALQLFTRLENVDKNDDPIFSVEFNNPKARLSSLYYFFLMEYFHFKCPIGINNFSGTSLTINQFNSQSHLVDSLLSGEIKDFFITCRLADMYFMGNSASDMRMADTFIKENYSKLSDDQLKYLEYEKNQTMRAQKIRNALSLGDKAPRFYLMDTTGKPYELKNFKGKIVYIHFWATWCEPCIREIPKLNQLYSRLDNKKVEIINICLDSNPDKWKQIIQKGNLKGTNLICKGSWETSLKDLYFITEVPHYTLIDQNGFILKNKCSAAEEIYLEISQLSAKK